MSVNPKFSPTFESIQRTSFIMPATINSLAPETLGEIFLHALLSQSVEDWYTSTLPALLLVSPHFRAIIESYTALWTSLFVTEKSAHIPGKSLFESTYSRLRRSGTHPLSIVIKLPSKPMRNVFARREAEILGEIIRSVAPRVQSLEIRSESRVLQMAVLCQLGGTPVPLLRSFTHVGSEDPAIGLLDKYPKPGYFQRVGKWRPSVLQHLSTPSPGGRDSLNAWGREAYPVLEDIEIVGAHYCWTYLPIMHGIRRISLGAQPEMSKIFVNTLLRMLEPIRETLEILQLGDMMRVDPDDFDPLLLVFSRLEVISLVYDHMSVVDNFFQSIIIPGLKDLSLTHVYEGRDTYDPSDPHYMPIIYLITMAPLEKVERLTLNGVVFPNEVLARVDIPPPGTELSKQREDYLMNELQLPGLEPIYGHWSMPLMMLFLFKFYSLKHLSLANLVCSDEEENLMKMIGRYWQQGTLGTLKTLHLDGPPEGVLDMLAAVEKDKKSGCRPLPLQISVGEKLESAFSEAEKSELQNYVNALKTV